MIGKLRGMRSSTLWPLSLILHHAKLTPKQQRCYFSLGKKVIKVLAIETSCDDTSVATAELTRYSRPHSPYGFGVGPSHPRTALAVRFHDKITANNDAYSGIHPLVALESHRSNLAKLVQTAQAASESNWFDRRYSPDLICVTRGPGMRSNLSVGLDTAKGLAVAFSAPLVGVHHMQAHALTPRLISAMRNAERGRRAMTPLEPRFPFLTVLVSGGHTMLVNSSSLVQHEMLAETQDIAMGDCLDKAARLILPAHLLKAPYGKALEHFAFPNGERDYHYVPPKRRQEELETRSTRWKWGFAPPLAESKGGEKSSRRMIYSFVGLLSSVQRFMTLETDSNGRLLQDTNRLPEHVSIEERRDMAREVQRVAFEHLASRVLLHLSSRHSPRESRIQDTSSNVADLDTIVVSGGVASNKYLRHVLRQMLDARGYSHINLNFPPISLCTDNALMIGWAGLEMYCSGYASDLSVGPIRKWSMDANSDDGGIFGVGGWRAAKDAIGQLL